MISLKNVKCLYGKETVGTMNMSRKQAGSVGCTYAHSCSVTKAPLETTEETGGLSERRAGDSCLVKRTDCSRRGPQLCTRHPHGGPQPSVRNSSSRDQAPSSSVCIRVHSWRQIQAASFNFKKKITQVAGEHIKICIMASVRG